MFVKSAKSNPNSLFSLNLQEVVRESHNISLYSEWKKIYILILHLLFYGLDEEIYTLSLQLGK